MQVLNKNICWKEYLKSYALLKDHGRAWRMSQCDKLPFEAQIELRALIGGGAYDADWYRRANYNKNIIISNIENNNIKLDIIKKIAKYVFPDKINLLFENKQNNNVNILFGLLKDRIANILKYFSNIEKITDDESRNRYEKITAVINNAINNNDTNLLDEKEFIMLLYGESGYIYKNIDKIISSIDMKNSNSLDDNLEIKFSTFLNMTKYLKYNELIEIVKDTNKLNFAIKFFMAVDNWDYQYKKPEINESLFFINSINELYNKQYDDKILGLLNMISDLHLMVDNLTNTEKKYYRAYNIAKENIDNGVNTYINNEYISYYERIIKFAYNKKINSILKGVEIHDQLINYFNHIVSFIRRILNEKPLNFPTPPINGISNENCEIKYLSNSFEIENEGNEMKHSVGAYAEKVMEKKSFYYSYINKITQNRGTIELNTNGNLVDFNGIKNAQMPEEDWNNVNQWLGIDNKQNLANLNNVFKYGKIDKKSVINLVSNYGLNNLIDLAKSKNYDTFKLWISLGNIYNKPIKARDIYIITSSVRNGNFNNSELTINRLGNWVNYILSRLYEDINNV